MVWFGFMVLNATFNNISALSNIKYVFYRNTSILLIDTTYVIQNVVSHTYVIQDVL
jgi:hypothetical protein